MQWDDHGRLLNVCGKHAGEPHITSVWSAYGHRFMSDEEPYESCLTCGATYQLLAVADDPTRGEYTASNGDEPMYCTGDTSMDHGYEAETHCNCVQCA